MSLPRTVHTFTRHGSPKTVVGILMAIVMPAFGIIGPAITGLHVQTSCGPAVSERVNQPPLSSKTKHIVTVRPLSGISDDQLRKQFRGGRSEELGGNLLVADWSALPGAKWIIQAPEAICSILVMPHQFVAAAVNWCSEGPSLCRFSGYRKLQTAVLKDGTLEDPLGRKQLDGTLAGRVEVMDHNVITLQFSLHNESQMEWKDLYAWVCLLHRFAPLPQLTYLRTDQGYRKAAEIPGLGGFAGARALTWRGKALRDHLLAQGVQPRWHPAHERLVDPVRVITTEMDGEPFTVGIVSPDALVVGGKDSNPCTDLGVGFGNILPGGTGTARLEIHFVEGTLDDFSQPQGFTTVPSMDRSKG